MSNADPNYNFYRIDDLLLRAAAISAPVVVVLLATGRLADVAGEVMLIAVLAPIAMLIAGLRVRRREKQTLAIWQMLDRNVSLNVGDVVANSDFSRADIMRAVRLLNNRGLGYYIWHRDSDRIEDGRLSDEYIHIENCESCAAPVGLKVPVSLREVPRCPYCHAPAASGHLNLLKRATINQLRGGSEPVKPPMGVPVPVGRKPMSITLFIVLLIFFWPAAVAYAVIKTNSRYRID